MLNVFQIQFNEFIIIYYKSLIAMDAKATEDKTINEEKKNSSKKTKIKD